MKKSALIALVVVAALMMTLAAAVFANEDEEVFFAYGTPTVDGAVDDVWSAATGYKTLNIYQGAEAKSDNVSEWKFMWDENRLYVLVVVTDSQLNAESTTYWQNDCTQLFIDLTDSSDFASCEYDGMTSMGVRFAWLGGIMQLPEAFVLEFLGGGGEYYEGEDEYENFVKAQVTTDTGFIVEYSFDPTMYNSDFKLAAGTQGGIDFVNDDSMEGSTGRDTLFMWSVGGNTWASPANLSTFTLAAAGDSAVEETVEETPAVEETVEETPAVEETVEEAPVAEETPAVETAPQTSDITVLCLCALAALGMAIVLTKKLRA